MATHFHPLTVKDIRRETADCISIAFEIPPHLKNEFLFTQGQNLTIKAVIDGEALRRSYSVCSSPLEDELRIAVKEVSRGKFSSWANSQLKKGAVLEVLPATGKFYTALHPANRKNYIAFAAGSGITPVLSIIKTTLLTEPESRFTLIYGNRNRSAIIFKEELEALKNKFMDRFSIHYILSREKTDSPLHEGRINAKKCDLIFRYLLDLKTCHDFFLCGPEEMIFCVKDFLERNAVDQKKIHFELFTPPERKIPPITGPEPGLARVFQEKTAKVRLKSDGISFDFDLPYDGQSVLDAALNQGADLPFACKGGVCASCRAKLTEGKVDMDTNYALEPDELENGFILTCQSHPRSDKLTIDFDLK